MDRSARSPGTTAFDGPARRAGIWRAAMGRIINSTFVSIDGVINHMDAWHWAYTDEEAGEIAAEQLLATDALLMGRKTYEAYAAVWPQRDGA
jgi:hypothetical protein